MKSLRMVGVQPNLFKVRVRDENKFREFGYNERYRNICLDHARMRDRPKLIVAAAKNFQFETEMLWKQGAGLVVHDPTELKNLPADVKDSERVVVVRQVGLEHLPKAVFIRHPYVRVQEPEFWPRTRHAISVSRVDFDKHTDILLDANRLLPEEKRISIRGFENRIYTRFKIVPKYPEWVQSVGHFPRGEREAFRLLQEHHFHVDMSEIKGDGGGTQYTFLEAWDAGCINVINTAWVRDMDDMVPGFNCLDASNAEELAAILAGGTHTNEQLSSIQQEGYLQLTLHHPNHIGKQYKHFLKGL
jgi:glycosyltransferase involved in cell wall biosynthesis